MYKIFKNTLPGLALLGLVLGGCQPELEAPKADKGSADFSKYVAVGNSLTAGYQSGGLSNASQANSYPAMLAMQFKKVGGGDFVQPSFKAGQENGSGYLSLAGFNANGTPRLVPVTTSLAYTGQQLPSGQNQLTAYEGAQPNNLGVPGISVISSVSELTGGLAPYGAINPFFNRLLSGTEVLTTDYLTYIGRATPTFFTFWLGNNDVLTYATNGGVASATNPFSGLSDTTRFGRGYRALLGTISKNGTVKGAVANIPGVTALPYFTTVRVAAINASIKANPALPNAALAGLYITTGKGEVRAATASDLLVLTSTSVIGTPSTDANNPFPVGVGYAPTQSNPLPSQYVLDADEISAITTRTAQLNSIIAKSARQYKQPLVDMATLFTGISANGIATNGVTNTTSFISGNLFSLDGVHPTPRGYAVVANEFIRVINQTYGASVPFLNPNEYPGIPLP
ncbi:G-D-S-L family lipolytic protein [Hymenobacter lutimineralis]|uniref:G-D-S-L family lipolytic protein n=1 Tax=Hymenobacter lutimineralis TaxID=2606448 RepID=A0A5D6V177_9BACT|nr:SGNH/GDSL hydrolase family protein [Hymenobacter lutimineralis]TYZ09296.1 G-D-S-L family lipolytic protein [Hymenobacter lutimineralis]